MEDEVGFPTKEVVRDPEVNSSDQPRHALEKIVRESLKDQPEKIEEVIAKLRDIPEEVQTLLLPDLQKPPLDTIELLDCIGSYGEKWTAVREPDPFDESKITVKIRPEYKLEFQSNPPSYSDGTRHVSVMPEYLMGRLSTNPEWQKIGVERVDALSRPYMASYYEARIPKATSSNANIN